MALQEIPTFELLLYLADWGQDVEQQRDPRTLRLFDAGPDQSVTAAAFTVAVDSRATACRYQRRRRRRRCWRASLAMLIRDERRRQDRRE